MPGRIWLVGTSALWNTQVGEVLAARLGLPFVDTEAQIVARLGGPMTDLWSEWGEDGRRRVEAEEVVRAAVGPPNVVAAGSGVLLVPESVTMMRHSGTIVWLDASSLGPADGTAGTHPPVGETADGWPAVHDEPDYASAAHHRVAIDDLSAEQVARAVIRLLESE